MRKMDTILTKTPKQSHSPIHVEDSAEQPSPAFEPNALFTDDSKVNDNNNIKSYYKQQVI